MAKSKKKTSKPKKATTPKTKKDGSPRKPRISLVNKVEREVEYGGQTVLATLFEATSPIDAETKKVFPSRKEANAWVTTIRANKKGKKIVKLVTKFYEKISTVNHESYMNMVSDEEWERFCDLVNLAREVAGIADE